MKATGNKPRKSKSLPLQKNETTAARPVRIMLTQAERQLVLKACMKYRYTIPAYIKSKQPEVDALNAIIEKLS